MKKKKYKKARMLRHVSSFCNIRHAKLHHDRDN